MQAIQADITPLKADAIVNAANRTLRGGGAGEAELLARCYRRSLDIAAERGLKSIAFPCISTGVYGYPIEAAARVAIETVAAFLAGRPDAPAVTFCCFSERDLGGYRRELAKRGPAR